MLSKFVVNKALNKIILFAGAGVSQESGLSTFRDKNGLWQLNDVNEVCNYTRFFQNKENTAYRTKLFSFYNSLKQSCDQAEPNEAHREVARWQNQYGCDKVLIFTSNVDDLFEKAGCQKVVHLHGGLQHQHCVSCQYVWSVTEFCDVRCPTCNSRLTKPFVVFFGERAPSYKLLDQAFHPKRRSSDDFLIYAGSSQSVLAPDRLIIKKPGGALGTKILVNVCAHEQDVLFDEKIYLPAGEAFKLISRKWQL